MTSTRPVTRRRRVTPRFDTLETRTLLSVTPNDTYYPQQWGLNNANDVDIDAPQAWDVTTGSSSEIVAAVGLTGVDLTNPDLANRIWTNPNPNSDPNYPNALHGWNFITNSPTITDTNGHDTNVAGIVAAQTNNSQGVAGVTWGPSFMPLVTNTPAESAEAVDFAVAHGAKVINMSFFYTEPAVDVPYDQLYQAIEQAANSGVVVVAAAGNGGTSGSTSSPGQDLLTLNLYPAGFELPNMISVAAVDSSGNLASFSNYGASAVNLGAPGVNIYTTGLNGGYNSGATGTSFAAPFVTGVAALVQSEFPSLSAQQVVQLVVNNTKPLAGLSGKTISGGMVDALNALLAGFPTPTASASPTTVTGTQTALSVADNYGAGDADLTYTWTVTAKPSGAQTPTFTGNANGTGAAKNITANFYGAGNYTFQAMISDGEGFTTSASVTVTVNQTPTSVTISPRSATVSDGGVQGFAALVDDQFNSVISSPSLTWSVNSGGVGGTINQGGTYTAPTSGTGTDTVKVTTGSASATATVTVTGTSTAIQVDLSGNFNVDGITADNNMSPGNLDGGGSSYSSNLLGSSVSLNGINYNIGTPDTNNVVNASGQTIPLPSGDYSSLGFLATAFGGAQTGTFTVTYADQTTTQITQTLDDWANHVGQTGESVAKSMSYRNHDKYGPVYLYSYSITLNSAKSVASITLPSGANIVLLAIDLVPVPTSATQVNLSGNFNLDGITADNNMSPGNLDGGGASYSSNLLGPSVSLNGISYNIGTPDTNNVVKASGQTIPLPSGNYSSLGFLATAFGGAQTGTFTVTYTDQATTQITQTLDDWCDDIGQTGESVAKAMSYRNHDKYGPVYLYSYSITLNPAKTVQSITLPSGANIVILAIDLVP